MATGLKIFFTIPQANKMKLGYRIAGSTSSFTYLPQYINSFESPYLLSGLSDSSYELEMTTVSDCCGDCSNPTYVYALYQETGKVNCSIIFNIDGSGTLQAIVQLSEIVNSTITITGNYTIKDINGTVATDEAWTINLPANVKVFVADIRQATPTSTIDTSCVSSISPSTVGAKTITIVNIPSC